MPEDGSVPPGPAVPRGWKINDILPLHSPAVSGGGISENFMKDIMAEMAGKGGLPGQLAEASSAGGGGGQVAKKKKEKGKGKK
jgi:signal recognition particle subunit SRP19